MSNATSFENPFTFELASLLENEIGGPIHSRTSQRRAYMFALNALDFIENDYGSFTMGDSPTTTLLERVKELREVEHDCQYLLDAFMKVLQDNYDYLSSGQQERIAFLGFELQSA